MLLFTLLYLLAPALAEKGYRRTCRFIGFWDNWHTAEFCCRYSPAGTSEQRNLLDLDNFIGNRFGNLVWQDNGGFHESCGSCRMYDDFQTLGCICFDGTNWPNERWTMLESGLDRLESRLINENGFLVCKDNALLNAQVMGDC